MEEEKQNSDAALPELNLNQASPAEPASSADEQARIDSLVAHNPAEDVVELGRVEDLEKILQPPVAAAPAVEQSVVLPQSKLLLIKKIAQNLRDSAAQLVELLTVAADEEIKLKTAQTGQAKPVMDEAGGSVVEGIFDGEKMVGPDGKTYNVPVNYASKSRLVEGDSLKLIITAAGTFIFKQIKPVDRRRLVGLLEESDSGEYYVMADDRRWRVLAASVTYFKGEAGDEVAIVVPREGLSRWAAVENIIKR